MNGTAAARFLRLGVSLAGLVTLGWVLTGQAARPAHHGIPVPTDWSHSHLIFSSPGSAEQIARVSQDPRYWQQVARREQRLALPARIVDGSSIGEIARRYSAPDNSKFKRDWSQLLGASASNASAGVYPAKYAFESTVANCAGAPTPDYVVYSTGLAGTTGQADIVAYDNLYSGCTGTAPTVYWAYNTSGTSSGQVLTSPVLSKDGTQIAFVQTNGAGAATVVLLKWAAGTGTVGSPDSLTWLTPTAYSTCTAPCMTTFGLEDRSHVFTDDTTSSVFYDYSGDTAWVGDSRGWLHKFHPFFNGVAAELGGSWPVQVSATLPLDSPVYDSGPNAVFVAGIEDGTLYRVNPTTGGTTASGQLDWAISLGGPIVDSTSGLVYAFAADDGEQGCGTAGADCSGVFQLPTNFTAGDLGVEATVGTATFLGAPQPNPLYDGDFDNDYLSSSNATGNLYICGNTGLNPTIYQVPIQTGVMAGSGVAISVLAATSTNPACSPVTDVSDPGATGTAATERLFVSVQNNATAATCAGGGCIQNFIDTPWQVSTTFALGQQILVRSSGPALRYVYVAITATGTSGTLPPSWGNTPGGTKLDGTVTWLNQGNPALALAGWVANKSYSVGGRILDSNGNVEDVRATPSGAGTSGGTVPTWNTAIGGTTADGTVTPVTWINAGPPPTIGLAVSGGTSPIILDNTVGSGVLAGTSQVYFTTLGSQVCGTSGTGGCAVQASQSGLQ
jgi:hypothetical protein